jgi:general secretion pathway protein L
MEREVAALRQSTGASSGRDLEAILAALGAVAPAGRTVSAIDFNATEARVKGLQLAEPDLANVAAQLTSFGYVTRNEGDTMIIRQEGARPAP